MLVEQNRVAWQKEVNGIKKGMYIYKLNLNVILAENNRETLSQRAGYLCHGEDLELGIEHLSIPVLTSEHTVKGGWAALRHLQLGKMHGYMT